MLRQYNLVEKIKPHEDSGTGRLFSWHCLIGQFAKMTRLAWPSVHLDKMPSELNLVMKSLQSETKAETEARLQKQQFENYVPASERRPLDEFYDLTTLEKDCIGGPIDIRKEGEPGTFLKYVVRASTSKFGRKIESGDFVYYKCETRFSNGQLVDFAEKRKAPQKFEMGNAAYIAHKKKAFETMGVGEIAWFALSYDYTNKLYHNVQQLTKFHEREKIGELVYIRLQIESVKRQPRYVDKNSFAGRKTFFDQCRELCKELMAEGQ